MIAEKSRISLISLGSNQNSALGDPLVTVQKAMLELAKLSKKKEKSSGLYATPAFPKGAGPDFVNAAMAIKTTLRPFDLMTILHEIEDRAGRLRTKRWGQRTLDLDLIAVGDAVLPDAHTQTHWRNLSLERQQEQAPAQLVLPHPRLQDRPFVLVPLCEVAPDWEHPLIGRTVKALCADIPAALRAEVRLLHPA